MKRMIIKGPDFCAVTENGVLTEYIPEDKEAQCGAIILGKIERMMAGMDCAFVDIGRKKDGFLPLNEISKSFSGKTPKSGDMIILQIRKEETGGKGAFLTRDITLPGKYILLMPMNRYIGVSKRIHDITIRERLKKTGEKISEGKFGVVMRNAAAYADPEEIQQEAKELNMVWLRISGQDASDCRPGSVLYEDDPVQRILEDYAATGIDGVIETDNADSAIRKQLRQALERKIRLPGGGNIVIDRCEAMTVIDVNTASAAGTAVKERNILATNLEACETISRQVRLRNLNGIILIDYIDMNSDTDRSLVMEKLQQCFSEDRIKTVIHGWTSLGLMEMTRKRTRPSLYEHMYQLCDECGGNGYILREQKE